MSAAFGLMLGVFVVIAVLRGPIGLAMIAGGIAYLGATGQDMGLAAEQILNSLFGSFVLIAVPMFIFAANVMNSGTLSERLYALARSEEHTSELQSLAYLVCRLLLEKKKTTTKQL